MYNLLTAQYYDEKLSNYLLNLIVDRAINIMKIYMYLAPILLSHVSATIGMLNINLSSKCLLVLMRYFNHNLRSCIFSCFVWRIFSKMTVLYLQINKKDMRFSLSNVQMSFAFWKFMIYLQRHSDDIIVSKLDI